MASDLQVSIGGIALKNPVICASTEAVITGAGLRAALDAGAAAVVMKSSSESRAARRQLEHTDYALLDDDWRVLPWDGEPPRRAHLLCRSGLSPLPFEDWLALAVEADREARTARSFVVPSLILADLERGVDLARRIEAAGLRLLEFNIGAPHGDEAAADAIAQVRAAERVREVVAALRAALSLPLWIKLTGQSEQIPALAAAAKEAGADAVVLMGRFMAMLPDVETQAPLLGTNAAYGGPWALPLTCRWLAECRRALGAEFPLLGTNGARTGLDVARMMLAGASAVELGSAVMTGSFDVLVDVLAELEHYLARKGQDAAELVGLAADRVAAYTDMPARPDHWRGFVPPESEA